MKGESENVIRNLKMLQLKFSDFSPVQCLTTFIHQVGAKARFRSLALAPAKKFVNDSATREFVVHHF